MSETRKGAHSLNKSLADPKTKVKIGCWYVRTMFSVGKTVVEEKWKKIRESYCETARDVLGYRARKSKGWIRAESWKGIEERKQLKQKSAGTRSERVRLKLQKDYRKKDTEVKRSLRKGKRAWANSTAKEAEDAEERGQMKSVYDATRRLCSEPPKKLDAARNNVGKLLTNEDEMRSLRLWPFWS